MSEELTPELIPMEDQMTQELVKANITEAIIAELRSTYLPLKIAGIDDKETYLLVKEGRKKCKTLRVEAKKICTNGREEAVAISKKWIAKEKEVTGRIGEVEDYLEEQEKAYEAEVAKEKEARKRKQEEQLILRQQILTGMGVLYADGLFAIGEVKFDLAAIKESDDDIWQESILPLYQSEYEKINEEEIAREKLRQEREAELRREQEELKQKQKELSDKEAALKLEADRQAAEAKAAREAKEKSRMDQLIALGLKFDYVDHFIGYDCFVPILDIMCHDDEKWAKLIEGVTGQVSRKKEEEAEEKRKEQEKDDLHKKRFSELLPYRNYEPSVSMEGLWVLDEEEFQKVLFDKKNAFDRAEEEKSKEIAEKSAKAERERIEEEQRQSEMKRKKELKDSRVAALEPYGAEGFQHNVDLSELPEDKWVKLITGVKKSHDEIIRQQEEERKAEELAQATEKVKWASFIDALTLLKIPEFKSGQYRKKAAILREKLDEIKAL